MKIIFFISALCLQLQWSYGIPASVGAYAYQDTAGNRYGGTYGLKDDQAVDFKNSYDDTTFQPNPFMGFPDLDSFFPEYFRNLENLIQEAFRKNAEQQQKALDAARKAFDLTSNQIGYVPNFDVDFNRFPGFPSFGFPNPGFGNPGFGSPGFGHMRSPFMKPFGENSAFAGGVVAPGFRHQMLAFSPTDPSMPNIDVTQFSEDTTSRSPGFYSVQSSSYVSSANLNGQQMNHKGGQTIVNDNGKITKYSLNN